MPSDYEYDVFFSYKRDSRTFVWRRQVLNILTLWLTQELNGQARIFVDESIEVADIWPDSLRQALTLSKCMVCVWSPQYFQSAWCVSEWKSFLERERRIKMRPHGLIAPMRFHDGEHFPSEAQKVQWVDVEEYALTLPAFWNTARAVDFEILLKKFATSVSRIVKNSPPFQPDWPVVDAQGLAGPNVELLLL